MPATIPEIRSQFSPVYAKSSPLHHSSIVVRCPTSSLPEQKDTDAGSCQRPPASLCSSGVYFRHWPDDQGFCH